MLDKMYNTKDGFTLTQLMLAVFITAIVVAYNMPSIIMSFGTVEVINNDKRTVAKMQENSRIICLESKRNKAIIIQDLASKYARFRLRDDWGNKFIFTKTENNKIQIKSSGKDTKSYKDDLIIIVDIDLKKFKWLKK